jgi:hypothetical protein
MPKRRTLAAAIAAATLLLGGAGAVAYANTMSVPPPQGPAAATNGPDVPGQPDLPEPGDTPDGPNG